MNRLFALLAALAWCATLPVPCLADEAWKCPDTGSTFCTGALPTPPDKLREAAYFVAPHGPPKHVAYVPKVRSMFGNNRYGVCVTSEEAFAKSCWIAGIQPEIDVPEQTVIDWARKHGVLNGADLGNVCDSMARGGFQVGEQLYNDGPKKLVDYKDEATLHAAIATGPVKVAIPARCLPGGAGSRDGWHSLDCRGGGSDHCVSLCGYGRADWLYGELGVPLPADLPADTEGYLCYTWSTIGFVATPWVRHAVVEAWIRTPTTLGVPPIHPPLDELPHPLRRLGVILLVFVLGGCLVGLAIVLGRRMFPKGPWFGP